MNVQLLQEHGILWGGGGNWQAWVDEWDALEELKRKGQDKATLALIGTVQVGGCKQAPSSFGVPMQPQAPGRLL